MPRRKAVSLTEQQRRAIDKAREERLTRAARRLREGAEELLSQCGGEEEGRVVSHFGLNVEVENSAGLRFRCAVRETVAENPVCGDRVHFLSKEEGQGVIVGIADRSSQLVRPGPYGRRLVVAANVDRVLVTTVAEEFNSGLVDRYLVAVGAAGVEAVLVVNKIDRLVEREGLEELIAPYEAMGYGVVRVSAVTGEGLAGLAECLGEGISVFVGHSGVGKSSLIGRWLPQGAKLPEVGDLSLGSGRGRHTTTTARLYHLESGGSLIDSPGVRSFGMWGMTAREVEYHFQDIRPFVNGCRFTDCTHTHEPGCALQDAAKKGAIHPRRLESLLRIQASLDE